MKIKSLAIASIISLLITTPVYGQVLENETTEQSQVIEYTVPNSNEKVDKILELAQYHCDKNTPYIFGAVSNGSNPNSFDCSSFVQWLYRNIGIELPRVSYEQAKVGQAVSINDIQPGDIICFVTSNRNNGDVTHVALYIGNNKIAHARNSKMGTRIDDYNTYWRSKTVTIRRVL